MRKVVVITGILLGSFAGIASAATHKPYPLKHPNREHCKAHYVKKVEHGKTWCVHLTPTYVTVFTPGGVGELDIQPYLYTGTKGHEGARLLGLPIRVTITNLTTGQPLGSFTEISFTTCSIRTSFNAQDTIQTLTPEALAPYSACALPTPVSLPAADAHNLIVSFAGNATYAPSSGEGI